jgi:hypothetical protein
MAQGDTGRGSSGTEELQRLLADFVRGVASLELHATAAQPEDLNRPGRMAPALPPLPPGGVSAFEAVATVGGGPATVAFPELFLDLPAVDASPRRPERVEARAALEAFPHVLEGLALLWNDAACLAYLQRLVVDTRGGRRGFPPEAMNELLFLFELRTLRP